MSGCQISISFLGSAEDLIAKARKMIIEQGGTFNGDALKGHFELKLFAGNKIVGDYSIASSTFDIIISEKPFMVSCKTIEHQLKNYLDSEPLNQQVT